MRLQTDWKNYLSAWKKASVTSRWNSKGQGGFKMTWKELKQIVKRLGVDDNTVIFIGIDYSTDKATSVKKSESSLGKHAIIITNE
jgi:hypothetical protein